MDYDVKKVFVAGVTRNPFMLKNNLHEIIQKDVIKPIVLIEKVENTFEFTPRKDKFYVPKKKSRLKVMTVRDIRTLFEKDTYETLPQELEKQQKLLLRKIREGYAKDENTKKIALNILKSDKPISRYSWQMLMNLNPERHSHPTQFVLWNGKCIQINGSKGGRNKFICRYDISRAKNALKEKPDTKIKKLNLRKKGLLRDSLNVRFKPGPLKKKADLDYSYQKYHVGEIKLVNLPRLGLNIEPLYGTALEPTVNRFLQNLCEDNGTISDKWAEFAVSMVGSVTSKGVRIKNKSAVTFNLDYNCNQRRILMRQCFDTKCNTLNNNSLTCAAGQEGTVFSDSFKSSEIKKVLDDILDSVEISLNQDLLYSGVDEPRETLKTNSSNDACGNSKEKGKRKYCELGKLDVTVIRISENRKTNDEAPCREKFCTLGCICDSLECGYNLKDHCGRVECMFDCNCDFSSYKIGESLDNSCSKFFPGLFYLDKTLNDKLAKEEQKFHQTVLVTNDKSILLKPKRRNWKTSKKYADFYSSMRLRSEIKNHREMSVVVTKIKCDNVEPWCMVHNLYKCFCKFKFTQSDSNELVKFEQTDENHLIPVYKEVLPIVDLTEKESNNTEFTNSKITTVDYYDDSSDNICARVKPYVDRKFSEGYYRRTNEKIAEMEKNDKKLHRKMVNLIKISLEHEEQSGEDVQNNSVDFDNAPFRVDELLSNILQEQAKITNSINPENDRLKAKKNNENAEAIRLPNKTKLVEWLETSYKKYKERVDNGLWKTVLHPPRFGKVALYPWDFILSRYREQKNFFLVSKQKPFRIFMALNTRLSMFENCINVYDIPESDINNYPVMVRNLIRNANNLKDNFCILCGLSHCWELVGSVTKVNENKSNQSVFSTVEKSDNKSIVSDIDTMEGLPNNSLHADLNTIEDSSNSGKSPLHQVIYQSDLDNLEFMPAKFTSNRNESEDSEFSKWFIMTIENDISEIQFYIKGFFVKYDSIVKAIQVSRRVGKTVRLSSHRCYDGSIGPQFGIYATPNMTENSVFVGPYEINELLGIETLKNPVKSCNKNVTKGTCIVVRKANNANVLDNTLLFMSSLKKDNKVATSGNEINLKTHNSLERKVLAKDETLAVSKESVNPVKSKEKGAKVVKPIKIRKTDGFYHLASQSLIKKLPIKNIIQQKNESVFDKPAAEVATQIKITNIESLCNNDVSGTNVTINKKSEKGMFVLKPEEINKRLINNFFRVMQSDDSNITTSSTVVSNEEGIDDENCLESSKICTDPVTDVYVISDDDEDFNNISIDSSFYTKVWITCSNIKSIGWLVGRRNKENKLSFQFPGFQYTNFFEEEEAFKQINRIVSEKVFVPKNITLKWRVVESEENVNVEHELRLEDLSKDFVLTEQGLLNKNNLNCRDIKSFNTDDNVALETLAVASTSADCTEHSVKNEINEE
ncbi:uncharacterized protein ocm isoform X2 [Battus philenor]